MFLCLWTNQWRRTNYREPLNDMHGMDSGSIFMHILAFLERPSLGFSAYCPSKEDPETRWTKSRLVSSKLGHTLPNAFQLLCQLWIRRLPRHPKGAMEEARMTTCKTERENQRIYVRSRSQNVRPRETPDLGCSFPKNHCNSGNTSL